jgi:integrase/recombinase XerD
MNHPRQPARSVTTTVRAMRGRPRGGLVAMPDPRTEDEQCLRGLADRFLSRMAARAYSPGSVEAHAWALKYFIDWAVSRRLLTPAAFTRPLLEEYQLFLHQFRSTRTGALLAVNTQLARLGVIRRFFAWLCRENIIPANPAADLDLPRKQARLLPKSLAIEEIDRLLALPDVSSPFGARDRALLELFYATGVRRTEMVRLELGDFDPAQRTLHVRRGKGGKSRLLPVGDRAARWLSHYLAEIRPLLAGHPGERALFLSGYGSPFSPAYLGNWVARQMKKAGIEKKGSCHLFRHSCATHMLEGGADIRYIQQMLGHARLDTTQIYTEVSIRALTEAHARSHPHGRLPVSGEGPVDSNGASGSLSPVPEPPIGPVSVLASVLPATTVSHPTEDPEEPTAMEVDSDKPPTGPAVGTFQGMLEACGWPDGTDGGVIEYGYRYLDTQLGRWLSRDPIEEEGGPNLYMLTDNDAPNAIDLLGAIRNYLTKVVSKSYIDGVSPVIRPGSTHPSPGVLLPVSTIWGMFNPFNQRPITDDKDQTYRLYARMDVSYCCDKGRLVRESLATDKDGGIEGYVPVPHPPPIPFRIVPFYGSINLAAHLTRVSVSSVRLQWISWGSPHPALAEPGIQAVGSRTSNNIWNAGKILFFCVGDSGYYQIEKFSGSQFPSHALWVDGALKRRIRQAFLSDLWKPHPLAPSLVR